MMVRTVRWVGALWLVVTASCFPRLAPLTDAGAGDDGGPGDADLPFGLELIAGNIGGRGNVNGTGAAARFSSPSGIAIDSTGNLYVSDASNFTIRKISPAGVVTTFAGKMGTLGAEDGASTEASFVSPQGAAIDSAGTLYLADQSSNTIRKVTPAGVVSTMAGAPGMVGSQDGTGTAAKFRFPTGVAVDGAGNVYVADRSNHTIRKIDVAGMVITLAGTPGMIGSTNGTGSSARFSSPGDVAVDSAGNVYVADTGNSTIRKITPVGAVTTLAGFPGVTGASDGAGGAARFSSPRGLTVDAAGTIYVADSNNHTIRQITTAGVVTTIAGSPGMPGDVDGAGSPVRLFSPGHLTVDTAGNLYVTESTSCVVRKITSARVVSTIAGTPSLRGSADGTGASARFNAPQGVTADRAGNFYAVDASNQTIRKITPGGVVTTLAGAPGSVGSADGTASEARFNQPFAAVVDGAGNLYVSDEPNFTIRKITSGGTVTTVAGVAGMMGTADGMTSDARFGDPNGLALDSAGNLFVGDCSGPTIRKITPAGLVTTVAGTPGMVGTADGTGPDARFNCPLGLAFDSADNLYMADGNCVRKMTPGAVVTTLAGVCDMPGSIDGTGAAARLNIPVSAAVDGTGNVYVTDIRNHNIRKITPAGVTTTIAGVADTAIITLGSEPRLSLPLGLAITGDSLVLTDNNAVLLLRHGARP